MMDAGYIQALAAFGAMLLAQLTLMGGWTWWLFRDVRAETRQTRQELREDMRQLDHNLRSDMSQLDHALREEMSQDHTRQELRADMGPAGGNEPNAAGVAG
jgi:hypothetical protein